MRESLYAYCRRTGRAALLQEWDPTRNVPLTPEGISYGSHRKVWWTCEQGHSWQAAVCSRTEGSGCPFCKGRKIAVGESDLASQRPDLTAEWDREKNAPLTPEQVSVGSHRTVWWRCPKGHTYRSMVKSRASGTGCPYCAGRKVLPGFNDLATRMPRLAKEWHPTLNGALTPEMVTAGTDRKVWWQCRSGHVWCSTVSARAGLGTGCPVCTGKAVLPGVNDLATLHPGLAGEWDREKNGALTPEQVTVSSNRRVWWRCEKGHSYQAQVAARAGKGSGCPYCTGRKVLPGFNDLATRMPRLAAEWHPALNGALTPDMVTTGSHKKVWWQCPEGHVWKAVIYSRTGARKCGCPVCAGKVKPPINTRAPSPERRTGRPFPQMGNQDQGGTST